MSVKRRKGSKTYYTNFSHNGQRIRRSTGTVNKVQAQEYEDKLKERLWRQSKLGDRITHTWPEAANKYLLKETPRKCTSEQAMDKARILWLTKKLGDIALEDITSEIIEQLIEQLKSYTYLITLEKRKPKAKNIKGSACLYRNKTNKDILVYIVPIRGKPEILNLSNLCKQSHQQHLLDDLDWNQANKKRKTDRYPIKLNQDLIQLISTHCKPNRKAASINRYLEVLRSVLRKAATKWRDSNKNFWLPTLPTIEMLDEPKRRIRFLTHEEAQRLIAVTPPHLSNLIAFSLATGLRQANVLFLEWSEIDETAHHAWIPSDKAKTKKAISVPLNKVAMKIIKSQKGKHPVRVFTYNGKPINTVESRTWKKYLKKAGIKNFRWHDLRHTWASWHVKAGTPLQVLMELGGWSSMEMVLKYAHLSSDHLKHVAKNVEHAFEI